MTRALGASEAQIMADVARHQADSAKAEADYARVQIDRLIALLVARGVIDAIDMEGGK